MSEVAKVRTLPTCAFCPSQAGYDVKTLMGPWAFVCEAHLSMAAYQGELGTGKGQKLELE